MNVGIASSVVGSLRSHAAAAHPHEACGVLLGDAAGCIVEAVAARNVAAHPERSFEIEPAVLLASHRSARGRGLTVAGWYHSHPDGVGQPSPTDAARAVEDGKLWLVVAGDAVSAWRVVPGGPVHGRFETVALQPR